MPILQDPRQVQVQVQVSYRTEPYTQHSSMMIDPTISTLTSIVQYSTVQYHERNSRSASRPAGRPSIIETLKGAYTRPALPRYNPITIIITILIFRRRHRRRHRKSRYNDTQIPTTSRTQTTKYQ